jgi:hypothetical protein
MLDMISFSIKSSYENNTQHYMTYLWYLHVTVRMLYGKAIHNHLFICSISNKQPTTLQYRICHEKPTATDSQESPHLLGNSTAFWVEQVWKWRQHISLKHQWTPTKLSSIIVHKTTFINIIITYTLYFESFMSSYSSKATVPIVEI